MVVTERSKKLFARAERLIPGAVNSPVRAWGAVGGNPLFIERASGAYVFDADANQFIDYVGSYGPAILGHCYRQVVDELEKQARQGLGYGAPTWLEVDLAAELIRAIPSVEKIRLVSSGTEAAMTTVRIARAATGRSRIIKFDGCYHGHSDSLLVRAGSGGMTFGVASSAGVPQELANLTLVAEYNNLEDVDRCFRSARGEVAAVLVEPVAANMGVVPPAPGFLSELGGLARRNGALLVCDEVITGFRLGYGVVSERLGCRPDLIMLGKIIGGGLPIGAVGGKRELMDLLSPLGPVYQAGTLSGNPLSVVAGLATLAALRQSGVYERLELSGARLEVGLKRALELSGVAGCVNRAGSLLTLFLGCHEVRNGLQAKAADAGAFAMFFRAMLERGIYIAPSQFEALFISLAHSDSDLDATVTAAIASLGTVAAGRQA